MKLLNTKKLAMGLAAGAMAATTAMAVASPAHAAVVPVNFEGNGITFTAVQADQELNCPTFDLAGDFDDVANTGVLDDLTADGCTNDIAGSTEVTPNGAWDFATGSNIGGTVWNADITNVTANVVAAGCDFDVAGDVTGEFDTSTQSFVVTSSNVVIDNTPVGFLCPILGVAQGQDIEIDGSWTNTGTTITLP
jgi:hypothetical protein